MSTTSCKHCKRTFGVECHEMDAFIAGDLGDEPLAPWECGNPLCWEAPADVRQYDDGLPDFQPEKQKPVNPHPKARRVKVKQLAIEL